MVSRLFGANPLDELVDRATSEYLPAGQDDLMLTLEICDRIRSKQISGREAIRSLKRRIAHRNPNVQELSLNLTDACVKNGGQHFLIEVASRDFMTFLTDLVKSPVTQAQTRQHILRLLSTWAYSFRSHPDLTYVCDIVEGLKDEGIEMPAPSTESLLGGKAMFESAAPPEWTDGDCCSRCRTLFTFTTRKHHCRQCGKVFCQACSSQSLPLPHLGIVQSVRVCNGCYLSVKGVTKDTKVAGRAEGLRVRTGQDGGGEEEEEDDDFRRAIALSLEESKGHSNQAPAPPPPRPIIQVRSFPI